MLATVVEGKGDFADILFLIATILFVIVAVIRFTARTIDTMLAAVGLACVALAWLVL